MLGSLRSYNWWVVSLGCVFRKIQPQGLFMVSSSFAIDQPGTVDEEALNTLELNLSKAKTKSSQLKQQLSELEKTSSMQKLRIQMLERSISEILADIENLEEIRKNLPPGCYNTKPIERP